MTSLDITSLLTSVPPTKTPPLLCNQIENNKLDIRIPIHYLEEYPRCTLNVQFKFNSEFYRRTDGVVTGFVVFLLYVYEMAVISMIVFFA